MNELRVHVYGEFDALLDLATECRLATPQAREVVGRVTTAVSSWRSASAANGIGRAEQERFAEVFETQMTALTGVG